MMQAVRWCRKTTQVNTMVAEKLKNHPSGRVRLVNCGEPFVLVGSGEGSGRGGVAAADGDMGSKAKVVVKSELMPDLLHPNAQGYEFMLGPVAAALKQ